jgi:2-oxoglutarate ferredoxin oxidoreductase subunit beta
VRNDDGSVSTARVSDVDAARIVRHDEHAEDPTAAFALSRLTRSDHEPTPMGVFRSVEAPEYSRLADEQIASVQASKGPGSLEKLFRSNGSWTVN